jgi:putative transcriptional regulator
MGESGLSVVEHFQERDNGLNSLLADYAAGNLPAPLHGLVAGHLCLSGRNRAYVAALETLRALEIEEASSTPLDRRDVMLDRIFAAKPDATTPTKPMADALLPGPVAMLVGQDVSSIKWRTIMPGLKEYKLRKDRTCQASLLWINAGRVMPSHTHDGTEVTLVLKGGFRDASGHFCRGDISIADAEIDHRPRADDGEDCICFVVNDAALRLTGPVARFFHRLTRH